MVVANVNDVEKNNSYYAVDVLGEPIVIVKDVNGKLNAFYNVCRYYTLCIASVGLLNIKIFTLIQT